ncbi:MAG: TIGR03905 family TSCPD domain-containing protein [Candidatus Spyradocola sp.]|jgi:uncharacterized protein (TIGR03905 family)
MEIHYKTRGTCSRSIHVKLNDQGVIESCFFESGCPGNTQGVAALSVGRRAEDVIACCRGIQCRNGTSCPDQLAKALQAALDQQAQ